MKKIYFLCAIALLFFGTLGCDNKKDDNNYTYPPCMQEQIDIYLTNNPTPPSNPASIEKYSYNGKIVYIFERPYIIDGGFTVRDENCNIICGGGGITGENNCKFELKYIETVWTDNRKKQ